MENISQMSLLEVAILLMEQKKNQQPIKSLIKEVLEMKGLDDLDHSLATQLYWHYYKFEICIYGWWRMGFKDSSIIRWIR